MFSTIKNQYEKSKEFVAKAKADQINFEHSSQQQQAEFRARTGQGIAMARAQATMLRQQQLNSAYATLNQSVSGLVGNLATIESLKVKPPMVDVDNANANADQAQAHDEKLSDSIIPVESNKKEEPKTKFKDGALPKMYYMQDNDTTPRHVTILSGSDTTSTLTDNEKRVAFDLVKNDMQRVELQNYAKENEATSKEKILLRQRSVIKPNSARAELNSNSKFEFRDVKTGRYTQGPHKQALDSSNRTYIHSKIQGEFEFFANRDVILNDKLDLFQPIKVFGDRNITLQLQYYAQLARRVNLQFLFQEGLEFYYARGFNVINARRVTKYGVLRADIEIFNSEFSAGLKTSANAKAKQVIPEGYVGYKGMINLFSIKSQFESEPICYKSNCIQVQIEPQAGFGAGVEFAVGHISHKTTNVKSSTAILKIGYGEGLMLRFGARVKITSPVAVDNSMPLLFDRRVTA